MVLDLIEGAELFYCQIHSFLVDFRQTIVRILSFGGVQHSNCTNQKQQAGSHVSLSLGGEQGSLENKDPRSKQVLLWL